jgi:ferredoxin-type protein NapG
MKRRDFFKLGARKAAEIASHVANEKFAMRGENWLRPPFAQPELQFRLACTQCDKCIEACTYNVLFKLPARLGRQVADTPAMDLLKRGCHMCGDWPCVEACEPRALAPPDQDDRMPSAAVRLARVWIDTAICLPYLGPECGACADACPVEGALEWQGGLRPVVNDECCTGCALCREACILDPKAIKVAAFFPDKEAAEVS